jgi:hypothetical protein
VLKLPQIRLKASRKTESSDDNVLILLSSQTGVGFSAIENNAAEENAFAMSL